ncbi:hypothetical protein Trydic_g10425 [Trypoxylus dichotomus]
MEEEALEFCGDNAVVQEILEESDVLEENERHSYVSKSTPYWCVASLTDNLFLSSATAVTLENLESFGITCVINTAAELPQAPFSDPPISYFRIPFTDNGASDIFSCLDSTSYLIHKNISMGRRVLVHCVAGVSRSATFCIAYLMKYHRMTLLEAYNHVKLKRPMIRPNCGFFRQLIEYEKLLYESTTVTMVYNETVKMEIPDVYDCDYRNIVSFRRKRRDLVRRH